MNKSLKAFGIFVLLLGWILIPDGADAQTAGAAYSPDTSWVITSVNGNASVRSLDATVIPAAPGTELAEGMSVTTGDAGRMALTRAGDTITVAPGSEFSVGPDTADASSPNILQTLGTLLFNIDSSAGPRNFQVRTPYLAAVIKGTVFSVSVTPEGSALHVTEGLVQVADLATGQTGLVAVGQTARVSSSGGGGLNIDRGDGNGGAEPKKEGKNADPDQKNGKENATAAEAKKRNGERNKGIGVGLKIKEAIDTGIGDVAANTGGLVSASTPGHAQTTPGDARNQAPGRNKPGLNSGGPNLNNIAAIQSNAGGSNGGGNGGGLGGGVGGGQSGGVGGGQGGGVGGGQGGGVGGGQGGGVGGGQGGGVGGGQGGGGQGGGNS